MNFNNCNLEMIFPEEEAKVNYDDAMISSNNLQQDSSPNTDKFSTSSPLNINFATIFDIENNIDFSNTNEEDFNSYSFDYQDYEQCINTTSNNRDEEVNTWLDNIYDIRSGNFIRAVSSLSIVSPHINTHDICSNIEIASDEEDDTGDEEDDIDDVYEEDDYYDDDDYDNNCSHIKYVKDKDKINTKSSNKKRSSDEKDYPQISSSFFKYKDDKNINKCKQKQWTLEDVEQVMNSKTNPIGKYLRDAGIDSTEAISLMDKLEIAPMKERQKYGKRKKLSENEKYLQSRERNREHAKATRQRKKIFKAITIAREEAKKTNENINIILNKTSLIYENYPSLIKNLNSSSTVRRSSRQKIDNNFMTSNYVTQTLTEIFDEQN